MVIAKLMAANDMKSIYSEKYLTTYTAIKLPAMKAPPATILRKIAL
jgi:hypothetical protein